MEKMKGAKNDEKGESKKEGAPTRGGWSAKRVYWVYWDAEAQGRGPCCHFAELGCCCSVVSLLLLLLSAFIALRAYERGGLAVFGCLLSFSLRALRVRVLSKH